MNAFDEVIASLENVTGSNPTGTGSRRHSRCPAHEDSKPSLTVTSVDGKVLLHCHAGCTVDDVLTSLSLTKSDLFDAPPDGRRADSLAAQGALPVEYTYRDEHGELLYVVERRVGKKFLQRRPDGRDGWSWKLDGVRRVLYRLPEVIAAVSSGVPVYLVEGEKDVHSAESVGAVATCNSGGAGKWRQEYGDALTGARVIVVADKDEPGRRHAREVAASLDGVAESVVIVEAVTGKDLTDHLAAGHSIADLQPLTNDVPAASASRRLTLTSAADITVRPVHWLWDGRIAVGSLALLAGREGIGKSTVAYTIAADVTCGRLAGMNAGQPRAVIVAATEDSWSHTIVPRLMAAGADLKKVYRVDVVTSEGVDTGMSLPRDLVELEQAAREVSASLILLDPLMSRLDASLDSHKDAEVRLALEPLVRLADATSTAVLGLIHVNKSHSTDPLTLIMGSRAFAAVARAVLFVMTDPDDEATRMLGQPKNNLGRTDLPTLTFTIETAVVAETPDGIVSTSKVRWGAEVQRSIREALEASGDTADDRSATQDAGEWVIDYLTTLGGSADFGDIRTESAKAGHALATVKRARHRVGITSKTSGFPRTATWSLPLGSHPGETSPNELNEPHEPNEDQERSLGSPGSLAFTPRERADCATCGEPMTLIDDGQTRHPTCALAS